ncbi:MAG: glycosyltransferase family 39 protein [Pseudomonadota bacterium]|nr:glycosyltransferase family 39 protein [Pseudomonadota bacterium]
MKWSSGSAYLRQVIGGAPLGADAQWRVLAIGLAGCAFLLRILYGTHVELLPEEAYYWNYARHLDIAYLDHPPMVAWLIRAGTTLFGDTEVGVRCGALGCGVATAFFVFRLTRNLFDERSALLALAMAQILPFFFLSGLLMTPDASLTAAWAASLYFLERALTGERPQAWLWAGLSLGIGLLSKYTIGLLGVATLIFMLVDPASRPWFRRWEPYAGLLIAVAVFSPVIVWNAQHEWASFVFQTSRRLAEQPRFSLHKLIGAVVVLLTPLGLPAVAAALGRQPPAAGQAIARPWRFLQIAVLAPLAVFAVFSLRHEVKLDWTGAPCVAALPLMAFGLAEANGALPRARRWLLLAWPPTLALMLVIYGAGLYYLVLGIPGVGYTQHTELAPVEWRDFGVQVDGIADGLRAKYGDDLLVIGMDRYAIASELAFYSHDQTRAVAHTSSGHLFDDVGLMYERWFPVGLQTGRTLLLVAWDPGQLAVAHLEEHVEQLEPLQEGVLVRDGKSVRRYFYRVAHGYRYSRRDSREGARARE